MMNNSSESLVKIIPALRAAQQEIKYAIKDVQGQIQNRKYSYADLKEVWETAKDPMNKNLLSFSSCISMIDQKPFLTAIILHDSGEYLSSLIPLYLAVEDMQKMGSAITYARRYALCSMLNIITDDDDDGKSAGEKPTHPVQKILPAKPMPPKNTPNKSAPSPVKTESLPVPPGCINVKIAEQLYSKYNSLDSFGKNEVNNFIKEKEILSFRQLPIALLPELQKLIETFIPQEPEEF